MFAKKTKKVDDGELKVLTADDLGGKNIEEKRVEEREGQGEQRLSGSVRTVGMVGRVPLRSASGALINPGRYQTLRSVPPLRPVQPGLRPGIDMQGQTEKIQGVLDVGADGHAFLRPNFVPGVGDVYVSSSQIQRFRLREGDWIVGLARKPRETERFHSFLKADTVNGVEVEKMGQRPDFANLVPIYPQPQIKTETEQGILATRLIDLLCPIGFGQRGLVVSPPKAGKTWLLKQIAQGVAINYPKMKIMAVLVGERPEEVTDIRRSVKGEVVASNFDEKPEQQTRAAETAIARARRLVEMGEDVFIIFDSITRLARAYNLAVPSSGRILSGGFDPAALYPSKRFFGSAREIWNCTWIGSWRSSGFIRLLIYKDQAQERMTFCCLRMTGKR